MATFLQNLFKPKWQHKSAEMRLEAINTDLELDILINLAKSDDDLAVRKKAITYLTTLPDIRVFFSDKNTDIKNMAIRHYIEIATGADNAEQQIKNISQILTQHKNSTEILLTIACEAKDHELSQVALDLVHDEAALYDFIMISSSAKARLKAAEKITISSMLKKIESHFKGKDKTLHRFAKNKIQESIIAENTVLNAKENTASLLAQISLLSNQAFHPTYEGQLTHIKQAWGKAEYKDDLESNFIAAVSTCESTLEKHKEEQAKINSENAKKDESNSIFQSVLDTLQSNAKSYKETGVPDLVTITTDIKTAEEKWGQGTAIHSASKSMTADYQSAKDVLIALKNALDILDKNNNLLSKKTTNIDSKINLKKTTLSILDKIKWPTQFQKPTSLVEFETLASQLSNSITELQGSEQNHITETSNKLTELESAIENGNLKKAEKIQSDIKKELSLIERNHSKSIQSKFQFLSNQLSNLKDWKGFAAEPKFIELCENMEGLIGATIPVSELGESIKHLQEQWKALGSLGDKKQHDALWDRFKKASDQAYLPCKAHFKELSNLRTYNLEQRTIICEQLESLFQLQNWEDANWKALQKILDKAFHEYKTFSPVDRSVNATIQKRFSEATLSIKQKLQSFYQSNLSAKQAIINECNTLLKEEDLSSAIQTCKALQEQWRTIESAGKSEQALWTQFREKCDALFERRNEEFQAQKSKASGLIADAQSMVEQAKLLETSSDKDSLQATAQYKQDILTLNIPEKVANAKVHAISAIENTIKLNIEQANTSKKQQTWVNARELSNEISELELGAGHDSNTLQIKVQQTDLPNHVRDIFISRLESPTTVDAATLKNHCLDFEITMGIESPSSDQQERMAMQIKRLQENMGKTQPSRHEFSVHALLSWFAFSAKTDDYKGYKDRFFNAMDKSSAA